MTNEQKTKKHKRKGFSNQEPVGNFKLPKIINGVFAGAIALSIEEHLKNKPHIPLTTHWIRSQLSNGIEFKVTDDNFPTMKGEVFVINKDNIDTPIYVHTVRIWTASGWGVEVKKLRDGRIVVD